MRQPAHTRNARSITAGFLLAVIGGVLLLAQVAIPCSAPAKPRMSSKFDAMCKPPVYAVKANAKFLLKALTPEPLRLLALAAVLAAFAVSAARLRIDGSPLRPRPRRLPPIRDGSRLPFAASTRLCLRGLVPLRPH